MAVKVKTEEVKVEVEVIDTRKRDFFKGLNQTTIDTYKRVYNPIFKDKNKKQLKTLESMCEASWEAKAKLRELFNIGEDGYIKLPDCTTKTLNPKEILNALISSTQDQTTKTRLQDISSNIDEQNICCGYIHRKHAIKILQKAKAVWPDERNDSLSLTKLFTGIYDDKFSQVFSKIYNRQKGMSLYLSIRPMDLLMIGDHGVALNDSKRDTGSWWSCHETLGTDYTNALTTNLCTILDNCTFVIYSGVPEYEEYKYFNKGCGFTGNATLMGVNMGSRSLGWANEDTVVLDAPMQDKICAIDQFLVAEYLAKQLKIEKNPSSVGSINKSNECSKGPDAINGGGSDIACYAKKNNEKLLVCTHAYTLKPKLNTNWGTMPANIIDEIKTYVKDMGYNKNPQMLINVIETMKARKDGSTRKVWLFAIEGEGYDLKNMVMYTDGGHFEDGDHKGKIIVYCTKEPILEGYDISNKEDFTV